ncbi:MAG: hypothetical protein K2N25_08075, partial [Muribaculaceae bacterium]|nr:hypothetical protein [Muribaculaceae bacterium]
MSLGNYRLYSIEILKMVCCCRDGLHYRKDVQFRDDGSFLPNRDPDLPDGCHPDSMFRLVHPSPMKVRVPIRVHPNPKMDPSPSSMMVPI